MRNLSSHNLGFHRMRFDVSGKACSVGVLFAIWLGATIGIHSASAKDERPVSVSVTKNQNATNHWSLLPVRRPDIPPNPHSKWTARNPIDNFVLAKLTESKLSPSPEADRRTLIRRLYFDLIGLPPTPQEVESFEKDRDPQAYEKLADRLLASPRFGECWARHWLDVVRFAETHGFEMNNPRPNAWPYRDYVIQAFNNDKPYDQFILEQIAGDLFGVDEATGFLVGGAWDQVKSPDSVLTATQRADELHDMVSTTGSTYLGLTIGCARCHDHKFDPVPQRDYYALKACLAGVQHGEHKMRVADQTTREREARLCSEELAKVELQLIDHEPIARIISSNLGGPWRAPVNARRNIDRFQPVKAKRVRFTISRTTDAEPCLDELEVFTAEAVSRNVALASAGTQAKASSVYPNSEIHRIEHINDGKRGNSHSWISNERGKGWIELEFPEEILIRYVIWGRDREQKYSDRLALDYQIEVGTASQELARRGLLSQDRQPYKDGAELVSDALNTDGSEAGKRELKQLLAERSRLEAHLKDLSEVPMVYGGSFTPEPEPTHRLNRGDPTQEREIIQAGGVAIIPVEFRCVSEPVKEMEQNLRVQTLTADQRQRLALAHWISSPKNPLPARVMVNRLWLYHFGEGLVSTPSDFGVNGAKPSHPELLDWLAAELVKPTATYETAPSPVSWSLKHIHRLIVTSSTYRQASAARSDAAAKDSGSRLLWCFPPRRLDAEALRDAILATTGHLDLSMGGPGFSVFEPNDNYVRVYNPKQEFGPPEWRRMVYMTKVRMQQDSTFGAFDCPDGGQIAPKRMRSTTPLQALNLLNSGFMLQQAGLFAERLRNEASVDTQVRIRLAFKLAFSRDPTPDESRAAEKLIAEHGLELFCRALLNSNEFVFMD